MNFGRYRLLNQLGAGRDGVTYRAVLPDDSAAELVDLSHARAAGERWAILQRRLRLAAMLKNPAARRVLELKLDHDPPFVVLEWLDPPRPEDIRDLRPPLAVEQAAALLAPIAEAVAEANRMGLVHGQLGAGCLSFDLARGLVCDFSGLEAFRPQGLLWPGLLPAASTDLTKHDFAADVHDIGVLLQWLLQSQILSLSHDPGPASELLSRMLAADSEQRPSAMEVAAQLRILSGLRSPEATITSTPEDLVATQERLGTADSPAQANAPAPRVKDRSIVVDPLAHRTHLGRFRLVEKLGEGGMGTVYRAEDPLDARHVAIKVIRPDRAENPATLRRFHKEARLLAEVNNPFVTNLLEVNEDDGLHYLVLEFVAGKNLGQLLDERTRLSEAESLAIIADVARALADAHERGIVHRDIKPDNILLAEPSGEPGALGRVKLSDFGLARHIVETQSLDLTQPGSVLGTPHYMAPEQCKGQAVDARADVYALGATMYRMLAGRPPFVADTILAVLEQHRSENLPALQGFNAIVSDGVSRLVEQMLAKDPDARPANAVMVLHELERLQRGEAAPIELHPKLPARNSGRELLYEWTWELDSPPRALWPLVSNTERLNRAIGLPSIQFTTKPDAELGVRRFAHVHKFGVAMDYEEHPFEWVEGRRMGVLREFTRGPFKWFTSVAELIPRAGGGTTLRHKVRLEPNGLFGRAVAAVEVAWKVRRNLDRVYRRFDAILTGRLGDSVLIDPFEEPVANSGSQRQHLEALLPKWIEAGVNPAVVEQFGAFLSDAPAQEVARIRPLALARRLALEPDAVVAACLHGSRLGLLILLWDILCPVCRIPSQIQDTLRAVKDHGHCEACRLDFQLDFANSVEMIFRAHPSIRDTELGTYCVGGPAHSPHVVAQVRLAAGEHFRLELTLTEGTYRLRGPQLPFAREFRVEPTAESGLFTAKAARRWDIVLPGMSSENSPILAAGGQMLHLTNTLAHELLVRIERTAPRQDALTAARAATSALFRELFPGEMLSPGQLVSVSATTFLVTDLVNAESLCETMGEVRTFALIHEQFRIFDDRIRKAGGALVKTVGSGILAAFTDTLAAVQVGLELQALLLAHGTTRDLQLRAGVHHGPALAATLNDHLDYFGITVNQAAALPPFARGAEVLLTQSVAADPVIAAWLHTTRRGGELFQADLPGQPAAVVLRLAANK